MSWYDILRYDMLWFLMPCDVIWYKILPCVIDMICYDMLYDVRWYDVMWCDVSWCDT